MGWTSAFDPMATSTASSTSASTSSSSVSDSSDRAKVRIHSFSYHITFWITIKLTSSCKTILIFVFAIAALLLIIAALLWRFVIDSLLAPTCRRPSLTLLCWDFWPTQIPLHPQTQPLHAILLRRSQPPHHQTPFHTPPSPRILLPNPIPNTLPPRQSHHRHTPRSFSRPHPHPYSSNKRSRAQSQL